MPNSRYDVVIIGAGVSGLALSVRLRNQGKSVLVIERNDYVGGKLAQTKWNGFIWDNGPSVFTLPQLIENLFVLSGKNPRDYFQYQKHSTSCKYFFPTGNELTIPSEIKKLKPLLEKKYSKKTAKRYLDYLKGSEKVWNRIGHFFLSRPKFGAKDLFKKEMIQRYPFFLTRPMRKTLHVYNRQKIGNEELTMIADRYATYVGSSPYKMGGIYSLIGHVEQNIGTYFPDGGMRSIPESIYSLSSELGTDYILANKSLSVSKKDNGYAVTTDAGEISCEKLVCGIDHLQFYKDIFPQNELFEKYSNQERSSTALVFYWAVDKVFDELDLHNIFFSSNYQDEFEGLFERKEISTDPTVYVHISSVAEPSQAPEGCQNWFVMVNAPSKVFFDQEEINRHRHNVIGKLKRSGIDVVPHILKEFHWSAKDIRDKTGGFDGALYGASSNGILAALHRHPNQLKEFENLYFCGGTAHPGGGIPQALKSAEIVSELIQNEK